MGKLNTMPPNPFPPSSDTAGGSDPYVLPAASSEVLGGIKVGSGLSIDANGVLSNDNPTPYTPINYSTTEQNTGLKWIDGRDIYVKTYDAGALPSSGNVTVQNDITNFGAVINVETVGISNDGYSFSNYGLVLNYVSASSFVFSVTVDATGYNGYVTVYYVKTT